MGPAEPRPSPTLRVAVYALALVGFVLLALRALLTGPVALDCGAGDGGVVRSCLDARVGAFARGGLWWTLPFALLAALHGRRRGALILAAGGGVWLLLHARFLADLAQALTADQWD